MPAKVTLFTERCQPKYDLGSGPYSQARWNPWGRFLAGAWRALQPALALRLWLAGWLAG